MEGAGLSSPATFNRALAPPVHVSSGQLTLGMLSKPKEKGKHLSCCGVPTRPGPGHGWMLLQVVGTGDWWILWSGVRGKHTFFGLLT